MRYRAALKLRGYLLLVGPATAGNRREWVVGDSSLCRFFATVPADSVATWHLSVQTTERYLGSKQRIRAAVNDLIGIEPPV